MYSKNFRYLPGLLSFWFSYLLFKEISHFIYEYWNLGASQESRM